MNRAGMEESTEQRAGVSSGMEGLSEFWRRNTSTLESVELACLLKALRKVTGHLGPNAGTVEYPGMSRGAVPSIIIDPGLVVGRYPVPPERVDELVGLVTHEALHRIEWSEYLWKRLEPDFQSMGPVPLVIFQKIIHTGEDIYVDMTADRTVFGLYTAKVRRIVFDSLREKAKPVPPSIDRLMYLWWTASWERDEGSPGDDVYREPLSALLSLSRCLMEVMNESTGPVARCERRAALYRETWNDLGESLFSWMVLDKRLQWYPVAVAERVHCGTVPPGREHKELPPVLLRRIETELAVTSSDITPLIRSVTGYDDDDVVPTSRWDYHIPAYPVVDRHLVGRLREIFRRYAKRRRTVSRGLASGVIDARRLYRAATTGACFKMAGTVPSLDWNVTFLMDASGSMRGSTWRIVENTVATIHRALLGHQSRLQAYAYFERDGVCMISRLIKGRRLFSVPPGGQTASGQAIIAAALFMSSEHTRRLLVHVTDGESNFGVPVQCGIEFCAREGIHLITLGCGCRDRKAMVDQYGRSIQFFDHFDQLPQAIEKLLRRSFLYGLLP